MTERKPFLTYLGWGTYLAAWIIWIFRENIGYYPKDNLSMIVFACLATIAIAVFISACFDVFASWNSHRGSIIFGGILCPIIFIAAICSLFFITTSNNKFIVAYPDDNPQKASVVKKTIPFNPFEESATDYRLAGYAYIDTVGVNYVFNGTPLEFHKKYHWQLGGQNLFHSTAQTTIIKIIKQSKKDCQGQLLAEQMCHLRGLLNTITLPNKIKFTGNINKSQYANRSDTVRIVGTQAVL